MVEDMKFQQISRCFLPFCLHQWFPTLSSIWQVFYTIIENLDEILAFFSAQ